MGRSPSITSFRKTLLTSWRRVRKQAAEEAAEVPLDLVPGIAPADINTAFDSDEVLRLSSPLLSIYWLNDALDRAHLPATPVYVAKPNREPSARGLWRDLT